MRKANYQEEMNVASSLEEDRDGREEDRQDDEQDVHCIDVLWR